MQAAAARSAVPQRLRRTDRLNAIPHQVAADGLGLLHALPIAAAIFTLNEGQLWVEAMNARFLELAGCGGSAEQFAETFKRYATSSGGAFTLAFLNDCSSAPDELGLVEGEGVARRVLTAKPSPLPLSTTGNPPSLVYAVRPTLEEGARKHPPAG